ncbi:MAG TPA: heavy metal translocating P-type ATPase [Devosia sp.]|nr:heavy metal translocating P-type ATPase [Devosia sp.]
MTCCVPGEEDVAQAATGGVESDSAALVALSRRLGDGTCQLEFAVPDAHCAACIRAIETGLKSLPQVVSARVNLSRRRVRIVFDPERGEASALSTAIRASGYHNYVLDPSDDSAGDPVLAELVKSLAVAGFAAGNIMLFSVSVWSGANDATRDLFHWISAIIALPAIAYAGRIFFRSAWRALRVGRTNMDVPISIGVTLAAALSLFETIVSGEHAYFDASTTLLFFLLVGRTLDHLMRERARSAVTNLARLQPRGGTRVLPDGGREYVQLDEIAPGMTLEIRAGERVPVDSALLDHNALFDYSIITGESAPHAVPQGDAVVAGANNLSGPLLVRAERASTESFLSRMAAMMEAAQDARTKPRRIAERAAAIYAPLVHATAFATFAGWLLATGDWHNALLNAVAVLIITCPCALALAVPIVHVVAAGRMFERGILMKDGAALERAAEIESVAFDKTGTLTLGEPRMVEQGELSDEARRIAASLAAASSHPLSRSISAMLGEQPSLGLSIREFPGRGIEGTDDNSGVWRLGSARWCGVVTSESSGPEVVLSKDGTALATFMFEDRVRPDASTAIRELSALGLPVRLLSGDRPEVANAVGMEVGIRDIAAGLLPEQKLAAVQQGRTMMVGDGVNDAPALSAAYVSVAPVSASDIGRSAADFVFTGDRLTAVPFIIAVARRAAALVTQNLTIAIGYNVFAVPLAISGHVTPLIAAIAMSSSSIVVVANALRLGLSHRRKRARAEEARGIVQVEPRAA